MTSDELFDHDKHCGVWYEYDCDCSVRYRGMEDYYDADFAAARKLAEDYASWEDENPPRTSKSARPTHTESGRGLKHILRIVEERRKK